MELFLERRGVQKNQILLWKIAMLIDAHTHLNQEQLFPERETHMKHFEESGGKYLINAGANTGYNQRGILIAQESLHKFPELRIKATIGYHPCDVKAEQQSNYPQMITDLEHQYIANKEHIAGIGECGVDLHYPDNAPAKDQQHILQLQAELAKKLGLPLVIHSRDAFEETLEVLKKFTELKIYFHCRGYGPKEIGILEKMFPQLWIGFTGVITYPKAQETRESFFAIKNAKILMETDAPYLPPQEFRGKMNSPAYLHYIYEYSAKLIGKNKEEREESIAKNFFALVEK